jgi:ketosteroid isomerase-like protein
MKNLLILLFIINGFTGYTQVANADDFDYLETNYRPDAVSVLADGRLLNGAETIANHWQHVFADNALTRSQLLLYVGLRRDVEYSYELSRWQTEQEEPFVQLIIWDNRGDKPLRALDFIVAYDNPIEDFSPIHASRKLWMEHCNAHAVDQLIAELYTSNTLYYNHRPLISGREALVEEYAYMASPDYQLQLTPIYLEPITDQLAFEIGQSSGSYGGKYIIVWQKQANGNWQVLLDANL